MTSESPSTTYSVEPRRSPSLAKRLQLFSGLVLLLFVGLHLVNVAAAAVDPALFDSLLGVFREVYRPDPVVEAIVIALPLALHLGASLVVAYERRQDSQGSRLVRSVRWSGTLMLLILGAHVFVSRWMPTTAGYSDSVAYESFGLENWPWWLIPYYAVLCGSAVLHGALGLAWGLRELGLMKAREERFRATAVTWLVMLAVAVFAGFGRLVWEAPSGDPTFYPSYKVLYDRVLPFMHARNPRER